MKEGAATTLTLNGIQRPFEVFNLKENINLPFVIVELDKVPAFDSEVWINGELKYLMPPDTQWARDAIEFFESEAVENQSFSIPSDQEEWKKLLESLGAERANHSGEINQIAWDRIDRMLLVHVLNAEHFKSAFAETLSEEVFLQELMSQNASPDKRRIRLAKVDQVIHNFLASGYSLEQQALVFTGAYKGTEFARRFSMRFDNLVKTGSVAFARDMRKFLTHQTLPFTQQTFSFTSASKEALFDISVTSSELMRNSQWSEESKVLIADSGEKVNLLEVLNEAFLKQREFWSWALRQAYSLNRIDRIIVGEITEEYNYVLTMGREGRPRQPWARSLS